MRLALLLYHLKNRYPPGWRALEKKTIAGHPWCAFDGATKQLQVHHIRPAHLYPDLVLHPDNLIVLCANCHLREGHVSNFQKGYDVDIAARAFANLTTIRTIQLAEEIH